MICIYPRPFRIIQYRCSGGFVDNLPVISNPDLFAKVYSWSNYVFPCMRQRSLLLLPKEEDPEPLHQWRKLIVDALQHFRALLQSLQELAICIDKFPGDADLHQALKIPSHLRNITTEMRGSKKKHCVGADVDMVKMFYQLRESASRVCQCLGWTSVRS